VRAEVPQGNNGIVEANEHDLVLVGVVADGAVRRELGRLDDTALVVHSLAVAASIG